MLVTLLLQLSVCRCVTVLSLRGIGDAFELFSLSRFRSPMDRYPAAGDDVLPVTQTIGGEVRVVTQVCLCMWFCARIAVRCKLSGLPARRRELRGITARM